MSTLSTRDCPSKSLAKAKQTHASAAAELERVVPMLDPTLFDDVNATLIKRIQSGVVMTLNKQFGNGRVKFKHSGLIPDKYSGLLMECANGSRDVIYGYCNSGHVYETIERMEYTSLPYQSMVARALTQYLAFRALICIGDGNCKLGTECADTLSCDIVESLTGPIQDTNIYMLLDCIRTGLGSDSIIVNDADTSITFTHSSRELSLVINNIIPKYTWVVLHIFMAYSTGLAASGDAGDSGLTQDNLDKLIAPFKKPPV
jgi:hypothetical protein